MVIKKENGGSSVVPTRWNREFGERLAKRRNELRLSQPELAQKTSIALKTIQNYEAGDSPTGKRLVLLARVLKCTAGWLLMGEGPEPGPPGQKTGQDKPRSIYKVEDRPDRVAAPEKEFDLHGGWKPQTDPEDWAMLNKAHAVLTSDTLYSTALAANINAFHRAMMADKKIGELENISKIQTDKIIALEKRLDDFEKKLDDKKSISL